MNTKPLDILTVLMVGLLLYCCQSPEKTPKYTDGFSEISKLYITVDSLMKMEGLQQAAFHNSSISDELSAILAYDQNCFAVKPESIDSILDQYKFVSAKETVLEVSKSAQILIINEAHHQPSHRQFTKGLLADLYANGYRHFGVEALDPAYFQFSRDTLPGFPHYYNGLFDGQEPSVLVPLAGSPAYMDSDSAWMDLYVFHPRLETMPETSEEFYLFRAEEEVIVRM